MCVCIYTYMENHPFCQGIAQWVDAEMVGLRNKILNLQHQLD